MIETQKQMSILLEHGDVDSETCKEIAVQEFRDSSTENLFSMPTSYFLIPRSITTNKSMISIKEFSDGAAPSIHRTIRMRHKETSMEYGKIRTKTKHILVDLVISPAVVDNEFKYPGLREERIETALAIIASTNTSRDFHIESLSHRLPTITVEFSLYRLKSVIEDHVGVKMNYDQIRKGLEVLNKSPLSFRPQKEYKQYAPDVDSTRISNLVVYTTPKNENDRAIRSEHKKSSCTLYPLFCSDIVQGRFRLHLMEIEKRIRDLNPIYLFRILSFFWSQAGVETVYNFSAKGFLTDSPSGFNEKNRNKSWQSITKILNSLIKERVIQSFDDNSCDKQYGRTPATKNTIVDKIYHLRAHEDFQKLMIKVNGIERQNASEFLKQINPIPSDID